MAKPSVSIMPSQTTNVAMVGICASATAAAVTAFVAPSAPRENTQKTHLRASATPVAAPQQSSASGAMTAMGALAGLAAAGMDFIIHSAADLCLGPESVSPLIEHASACDILVLQRKSYAGYMGWRVVTSLGNRLLLKLLYPVAGARIVDYNFTQIYRRSVVQQVLPLAKSPAFTTPEMILRGRYLGLRVRTKSVRHS